MVEKLNGCMYNITNKSAANYSRPPKLVTDEIWVIELKHNSLIYKSNLHFCE